ncbi:hypothetical protein LCGC14_1740390 [marine sediment metagenome]|uniref:Uncharacterized protein n=1 Tax=marine sediment metagenome TaxID=412755 RepID=A0A0F9HUH2_9ZZZZ
MKIYLFHQVFKQQKFQGGGFIDIGIMKTRIGSQIVYLFHFIENILNQTINI